MSTYVWLRCKHAEQGCIVECVTDGAFNWDWFTCATQTETIGIIVVNGG